MNRFIGMDVHKKVAEVACLDAEGRLVARERFSLTRERLAAFARGLSVDDAVALEATTNTWAVVDVLSGSPARIVVSNPLRTRAIAEAKIKTDRVDAEVLAQLLRAGYLPDVWIPDAATRALRRQVSRRAALVSDRTRIKNRLHSMLHHQLIACPHADLFSPAGRAWLASCPMAEPERAAVASDVRLLAAVEQELTQEETAAARTAYADPDIVLLMTLPGVDVTVAQGLKSAIGDPARFPRPERVASYLGLAPRVRQSAEHCYTGPITKAGSGHVRWLLVQAAQHLDRHPGPLGAFFRKLARRKNRNVAVVASARKLAELAWHLLTSREPYRYAMPRATEYKLARLRVRATGIKRVGGLPKGTPRSAAYGTGRRVRTTPALRQVYAAEGLPAAKAPAELPAGERRALNEMGVTAFAERIQNEQRISRGSDPR